MKNPKKVHDLSGQRFGRLTVVEMEDTNTRKTYWLCKCDCGNMKRVRSDSLLCGSIRSCGCLKAERDKINLNSSVAKKKHAEAGYKVGGTRLYNIWQGMKHRCNNPNDARYERYGGRGIHVCEEWEKDFIAFRNWSFENGYEDGLTIDRIDNDRGYSPDNCRWATLKEQSNNRSTNINITIGNSTRNLMEWCEIFGLDYKKIYARYRRGNFSSYEDLFCI